MAKVLFNVIANIRAQLDSVVKRKDRFRLVDILSEPANAVVQDYDFHLSLGRASQRRRSTAIVLFAPTFRDRGRRLCKPF